MTRLFTRRRDTTSRGQSLVEMALLLPLLMLIVLGTLEFGFVFDHHLSLEYATREGARTGSAIVNGGGPVGCPGTATTTEVDSSIIAAVERVLDSPDSPIDVADVTEIRIYKADVNGNQTGSQMNRWTPGAGPSVDGVSLSFARTGPEGWASCSRSNILPNAESIGVSLQYTYTYQTPLTALLGWATLTMSDRTVMQFNPTNDN